MKIVEKVCVVILSSLSFLGDGCKREIGEIVILGADCSKMVSLNIGL